MPIIKRQRNDGKVVFDVRAEYNGLRIQKTICTNYTSAKRLEARMLQDLIEGRHEILRQRKNPLFREYAEYYQQSVTWQKSYERTCRLIKHLVKFFERKCLTNMTVTDFIDYRTERLKQVKPATINREYACLKRMLNVAVMSDDYTISRNPLSEIKILEEKPAENRTLTLEEYHQLLEVAPEYFRRIIFFACNTAMRRTEIMNLRFGQIRIWPRGFEIELTDTKSGKRETVLLNQSTKELLLKIANERKIDLFNISEEDASQHVFLGKYGMPLRDFRHPMKATFDKSGIPYRPFHTFRHFWTSQMFNAGIDVGKIKKMGRWGDLQTMLRYCHSSRSEEQEAIEGLSNQLEKRPSKVYDFTASGNIAVIQAENGQKSMVADGP